MTPTTDHKHTARTDEDGDVVCTTCHIILRLGPLGINGYNMLTGERIGFVSGLAGSARVESARNL